MSSHHIVREKQEPALLILNLEAVDEDTLGQLLEWSPTLICNEETYEVLYSKGIKADILLCKSGHKLPLQEHLGFIVTDNPLASALDFLIDEGYPAVNIIVSDFNEHQYQKAAEQINLVVLSYPYRIFSIKSGFSKWKSRGESIKVITQAAQITSFSGLVHLTKNDFITTADGVYSLHFKERRLFIAETL